MGLGAGGSSSPSSVILDSGLFFIIVFFLKFISVAGCWFLVAG
jgi:hypothetical protein